MSQERGLQGDLGLTWFCVLSGAGESTAGGLVSGPRRWARFQFFQVESCLHMLPVLIFLQIKPVCSVAGGGRLSSEAFVTIVENVWLPIIYLALPASSCSSSALGCPWSGPSGQPQGTSASRIRPSWDEPLRLWCTGLMPSASTAWYLCPSSPGRQHSWILSTTDHHPSSRVNCHKLEESRG